ncbi:unnamed protein product [Didymodactylos carnosus]|nr:unnamed protein product [Didymodactylos carnosus]CAF3966998.1 unnamed protein product [Didymodactylos carnosus]
MSKIPHTNFKAKYEVQKEEERRIGPGAYEIKDFLIEADQKPQCSRGLLDQLTERFPKDIADKAPPPGAYGIPDQKIVEKRWQQGSNIPSFQWRQGDRTLPLEGADIGPGTYNLKSSVDDLLNKRVSEKGPYQLFSVSRSAPINTGHYAVLDTWDLREDFPSKNYPESTSSLKQLQHYSQAKHGLFSKLSRFQKKPTDRLAIEHPGLEPKNVDFPGPGAYNVPAHWERKDLHKKKIPFNSSSGRSDRRSIAFFSGSYNSVGVGRYNLVNPVRDETIADKRKRPKRRNIGFSSTTTRFSSADGEQILNERLKPQNLRSEQRLKRRVILAPETNWTSTKQYWCTRSNDANGSKFDEKIRLYVGYPDWLIQRKNLRNELNRLGNFVEFYEKKPILTDLEKRVLKRASKRDKSIQTDVMVPEHNRKYKHTVLPKIRLPPPMGMERIEEFLETNRWRLVDLFRKMDRDKDWNILKQDFMHMAEQQQLFISEENAEELMCVFCKDAKVPMNYKKFARGRLQYKREERARLRESLNKTPSSIDTQLSSDPSSSPSATSQNSRYLQIPPTSMAYPPSPKEETNNKRNQSSSSSIKSSAKDRHGRRTESSAGTKSTTSVNSNV